MQLVRKSYFTPGKLGQNFFLFIYFIYIFFYGFSRSGTTTTRGGTVLSEVPFIGHEKNMTTHTQTFNIEQNLGKHLNTASGTTCGYRKLPLINDEGDGLWGLNPYCRENWHVDI